MLLIWAGYCLPGYGLFMLNLMCFTGQILSSTMVSHTPFFSTKSNCLSVTDVQECCVKESLCQIQNCSKLVLVKVKSNLRISIYLYWFYGQEFILQLPLNTNS